MMDESQIRRLIETEVKRHLDIILHGSAGTNTQESEDIDSLYPGMGTIVKRPIMHPYGMASRAPKETISVVVKVGDHPGNRMTIGHRDSERPDDIQEGELVLYNELGQRIYLKVGKVLIGSSSADEPAVLGNVLVDMLTDLIGFIDSFAGTVETGPIAITTTPGNPAPTHPVVIAALTALRAQLALSKTQYLSTPTTNIISQEVFTERGGL